MANHRAKGRGSGFTLVEILIVISIVGVLLGIAVPNFTQAREEARQKACISNLRMIDSAKEMWALDNKKPKGTPVPLIWLIGSYLTGPQFATSSPASRALEFHCPSSGMLYGPTIGAVGEPSQCPTTWARTGLYAHILSP